MRLFDTTQLLAVLSNNKADNVKSWLEVIKPFREPNSVDKRTDKQIETDTINQYNEMFKIKEV